MPIVSFACNPRTFPKERLMAESIFFLAALSLASQVENLDSSRSLPLLRKDLRGCIMIRNGNVLRWKLPGVTGGVGTEMKTSSFLYVPSGT